MTVLRSSLVAILLVVLLAACVPASVATPAAGAPPASVGAPTSSPQSDRSTPTAAGAAPAANSTAAAPTKLTLAMGYIPSVQFAPFYVAQEKGYFRDAGLDVSFNYGLESDLLKLVGTNQVQFMIGSGDQVILGRSQGLPVRYVMRWYRRFPVVVFSKADSGVKTPKDLEGKRLAISALAGADYVGWQALVYATHIDPAKVSLQVVGYTQAAAISQGRVDAALDYAVNGPVQLRLAGQAVNTIAVSDFIDLPSNGIITNDQTIRDHPELAQALVSATLRGLQDTLANPDAAFQASLKAVPEAGGAQEATNRAIFDESVKLWLAEPGTLGLSDPAAWTQAATFMQQTKLIPTAVKPEELFTNQFVQK
jgi:NitT/TauT family transport system substrate-binding protein